MTAHPPTLLLPLNWAMVTPQNHQLRDANESVLANHFECDVILEVIHRCNSHDALVAALDAHERWLVDRIEWLRKEAHNGGHWEHLNARITEAAYTLEKFRALKSVQS